MDADGDGLSYMHIAMVVLRLRFCKVNPTKRRDPGLQRLSVSYMHVLGQNLKSCFMMFGCLTQYLPELSVREMVCTFAWGKYLLGARSARPFSFLFAIPFSCVCLLTPTPTRTNVQTILDCVVLCR